MEGIGGFIDGATAVAFVASLAFVIAVVNVIKKSFGVSGPLLMLIAVVVGVVLQVSVYYFGDDPLFRVVLIGLLYGGAASGAWDLFGTDKKTVHAPEEADDLPVVP